MLQRYVRCAEPGKVVNFSASALPPGLCRAVQAWIIRGCPKKLLSARSAFGALVRNDTRPEAKKMKSILSVIFALIISAPALADSGSLVAACARCHGTDGNSSGGQYPSLARQNKEYLVKQILDYQTGKRKDIQMSPMVGVLSNEDVLALAKFYSGENINKQNGIDQELAAKGKKIAADLKCASCHQSNYRGKKEVPRLSRQKRVYLVKQMQDYRDGTRTNDNGVKTPEVKKLTDEQITALSHYFSGM